MAKSPEEQQKLVQAFIDRFKDPAVEAAIHQIIDARLEAKLGASAASPSQKTAPLPAAADPQNENLAKRLLHPDVRKALERIIDARIDAYQVKQPVTPGKGWEEEPQQELVAIPLSPIPPSPFAGLGGDAPPVAPPPSEKAPPPAIRGKDYNPFADAEAAPAKERTDLAIPPMESPLKGRGAFGGGNQPATPAAAAPNPFDFSEPETPAAPAKPAPKPSAKSAAPEGLPVIDTSKDELKLPPAQRKLTTEEARKAKREEEKRLKDTFGNLFGDDSPGTGPSR